MSKQYTQTAMRFARFEVLDDGEGCYAEIPLCQGVFSNAPTLADCRDQLAEVLDEWIFFRSCRGLTLPVIAGITH
jgi:hypothetical protein